jgi:cob(I)alamin adenosyltransferase
MLKSEKRVSHVYTGNGKGKTSAAIGLAVRALGRGWKVLMIQFLKSESCSGENTAFKKMENFKCVQFGSPKFIKKGQIRPIDLRLAQKGFEMAENAVRKREWDMVILDEIILAVDFDLIPSEQLLGLMKDKPDSVELVLTGRNATPRLMEAADLVSEIKEIKHPYRKGIPARKGVEY